MRAVFRAADGCETALQLPDPPPLQYRLPILDHGGLVLWEEPGPIGEMAQIQMRTYRLARWIDGGAAVLYEEELPNPPRRAVESPRQVTRKMSLVTLSGKRKLRLESKGDTG